MMTIRERILAVYRGETPDAVPFMVDSQHWFAHRHSLPWDLSRSYESPQLDVIGWHTRMGIGFYMPNFAAFFTVEYPSDVRYTVETHRSGDEYSITYRFETPLGSISRRRVWQSGSYSWAIAEWGVTSEAQLRILAYALSRRRFAPIEGSHEAWAAAVGNCGVVYLPAGYSGMGVLLNQWMGIEHTIYAVQDWPTTVAETVEEINRSNLACIELLARSAADVILLGDNFSADVQPPHFFRRWSHAYYAAAVARAHAAGKAVAVHIDGRLRGALGMIRATGADCADAVTPAWPGDLGPEACRDEAGPRFILSGGIPPRLLLPGSRTSELKEAVLRWLSLRSAGPALIAGIGDEVPLGATEDRLELIRDLVETHGRY